MTITQIVKKYLSVLKRNEEFSKKEDKYWQEADKLEKLMLKELKKGIKLPRAKSIKVGNYRITCPIKFGWLKIRKVK